MKLFWYRLCDGFRFEYLIQSGMANACFFSMAQELPIKLGWKLGLLFLLAAFPFAIVAFALFRALLKEFRSRAPTTPVPPLPLSTHQIQQVESITRRIQPGMTLAEARAILREMNIEFHEAPPGSDKYATISFYLPKAGWVLQVWCYGHIWSQDAKVSRIVINPLSTNTLGGWLAASFFLIGTTTFASFFLR